MARPGHLANRFHPQTQASAFSRCRARNLHYNKEYIHMKIGIIGAGNIGTSLVRKLAKAGHAVKVANSKGVDSLRDLAQETGADAVEKNDAVKDVDAIILSIPFLAYEELTRLLDGVPSDVVVIDTSNYYPFRDGVIDGVDSEAPESVWVSERIGRPVVKAWNAALATTLADRGKPKGAEGRIALPVSGDDAAAKSVAMQLVEDTGFDALDAGSLANSWRQQPGTPAYCTELTRDALKQALAAADKKRAPENRETLIKGFIERYGQLTHDDTVAANRAGTA
ncbi:NAD(P)-binding domain-containing protein [Sphingobium sp. CR2-8]|uniref:NADPH-dependent F420 reductase n=1 Tax=Sphingobium sp. CR2-8 TaxID=1306534 RepID=UPI002DB94723|nr:NAD(P)-binding domain-containing protein [Sphingobium sp. CR2-8]MEC3909106.1 NAD(P)-binding domain-containing protein [Sphingobium sp. CR2-8]